jgi:hypothetical protein
MRVLQVSRKTGIFCGLYEKEKIYVVISLFFSTEFCLFTHATSRIFTKQLCGRVARDGVRANFLFQKF